jgi:hypothetical protein
VRVDDADGYGRIEVHSWERAAAQKSIIVDAVKRPAVTAPDSMRDPTRHTRGPHALPVAELIIAYAPWRLMEHRMEDHLLQPWILNYKPHPVRTALWR